jgi:hypothetical protein
VDVDVDVDVDENLGMEWLYSRVNILSQSVEPLTFVLLLPHKWFWLSIGIAMIDQSCVTVGGSKRIERDISTV